MTESIVTLDGIVNSLDSIRPARVAAMAEPNPARWQLTRAWLAGELSDVALMVIEHALPCPVRARSTVRLFLGTVR